MTLAAALCWLGVGLWLLADPARAQRCMPMLLEPRVNVSARRVTRRCTRGLRLGGGVLLLAAAVPIAHELGPALAGVGLLASAMTALSLAVVAFPLRPRWYAATLPLAVLVALASALG